MPSKTQDYRLCTICQTRYIPYNKQQKFCSAVCRGRHKYVSQEVTTKTQYELISGNWHKYLQRLLYSNGRRRDGLSLDILFEMLKQQNYLCALTGVPLTCELELGRNFQTNVTVDRIEAGGPYIKSNIQLVCKAVNKFRGDLSISSFQWWCKKVVENAEEA